MGGPSASSGSRSAGCPARSTGRIAFVRSVTAAAASSGSMFRSSSRTSTKTGVAPVCTITFAVAGQVIGEVTTSSPGPTPSATRERCNAAVPDASASTCSASRNSVIRRSSSAARGPLVSQPDRRVSVTSAISSSPIAGGWKPSMVCLLDESLDIHGLEANHRLGPSRTLQCLLAALAHGQDSACAVGATSQLSEAVAGAAIDADPTDSLPREGLLHAGHLAELARRGDEKPHTRAANPGHRREARGRNLFAEGRRERGAVQVDAERDSTQLRVMAAAEPGGELADPRALGPDQHLRVTRPVLDPDRTGRGRGSLDDRADLRGLQL